MVDAREPTLDEGRQLGAQHGYAIAEVIAARIGQGAPADEVTEMVEVARSGIAATLDELRRAGRGELFVEVYLMGCYEAMDHTMMRRAWGKAAPEGAVSLLTDLKGRTR